MKDFESIISKSVEEAAKILKESGYNLRVVNEDGEEHIVILNYRTDRVNVVVEKGKVVSIRGIG